MKNLNTRKNTSRFHALREYKARRQAANYERFLQEKADVFQITEEKDQAMFWALHG